MLVSTAYANGDYWAAAGREDELVPDPDAGGGRERAQRARSGARGNCARAGCASGEALGSFQAEENHVRDDRVRGHRRIAEGPREKLGVAGSVTRGRCAGARGAAVRESGGAARGRVDRRAARYCERGPRADLERSGAVREAD